MTETNISILQLYNIKPHKNYRANNQKIELRRYDPLHELFYSMTMKFMLRYKSMSDTMPNQQMIQNHSAKLFEWLNRRKWF